MLEDNSRLVDNVRIYEVHDTDGTYDGTAQTMLERRPFDAIATA